LLEVKRQASQDTGFNQFIIKSYLSTRDPMLCRRTWGTVMDQMKTHGRESTQTRCARAMNCAAFRSIRNIKLVETRSEDFLNILGNHPTLSVVHYLKRLHNLALGLGWLAFPILAPRLWPRVQAKGKRGITLEEHQRILASEQNSERKLFYQLLWEVGSSQSDAAALTAENIDWPSNSLTYSRMKTGERAQMAIGRSLAALLRQLPASGPLFPRLSQTANKDRAAEFRRRCRVAGVQGVSLHSYRYAWAERAKSCGYPERFAQEALGHNSKAVHRAYARGALVMIPAMEDFEVRRVAANVVTPPQSGATAAA
jgi:integrase